MLEKTARSTSVRNNAPFCRRTSLSMSEHSRVMSLLMQLDTFFRGKYLETTTEGMGEKKTLHNRNR